MDDRPKQQTLQQRWQSSTLADGNAQYLEYLYENYLEDPNSVDERWRQYFDALPRVNGGEQDESHAEVRDHFRNLVRHRETAQSPGATATDLVQERKQVRVLQLINAYRFRGHQEARINPLAAEEVADIPELRLHYHNLSDADFDTVFDTGSLVGPSRATLRDIMEILKATYCGTLAVEYMHLTDTNEKRWIQDQIESQRGHPQFDSRVRQRMLDRLNAAEGLERYLHTRYVGQKRFSLEGAESLIPLLDGVIQHGGAQGVKEVAIGMAHRGRLNVQINIMGKTPKDLFLEFEGKVERIRNATGDVKYHQGMSTNIQTGGGVVHVALAFNPSHLEIVSPVVEGSVRARQDWRHDTAGSEVMPVLIHGDAAFAGQGVVMETFNMSQSRGYSTKGTLHIVINNQIGFTTSSQRDARSTYYCTDVAKMVNAPILHVNGDDPEAVRFAAQVALDYRMTFRKDIVIDLVCYRRHGHSEADEPMATQPMMYSKIKARPTTFELYGQRLLHDGAVTEESLQTMRDDYRDALDAGRRVALDLANVEQVKHAQLSSWRPFTVEPDFSEVDTTVSLESIRGWTETIRQVPPGYELHPAVQKILDNRGKMAAGALPIDWGFAETMAYASLVDDGYHVRLSGQDSGRGTFFHRHAILLNQHDGESYIPLQHISATQGRFLVINSLLSEEAVLAFEYGYATTTPDTLVIWEAQFGDFANNAQVVIDQFISAGEKKWNRLSGLVMFLPHGYEGQGPEHSSARLERYMQLCANYNIQVCVPTTPAQIFHLLRRQMMRQCRKPLVVMTPKSLLRHPLAVNTLEDLTEGAYRKVLGEIDEHDPEQIRRVVFCSGKVYYDLLERRRKEECHHIAIIRLEQLYPFPRKALKRELDRYRKVETYVWCQEEPKNQGAWYTSQHHVRALLGKGASLEYAGRRASAAPAAGYMPLHIKQLRYLLDEALYGKAKK